MVQSSGSPSLIILTDSVGVKQHWTVVRVNELCESRRVRPRLHVSHGPYGLCGRKATLEVHWLRAQEL